ncbi:MAG: L-2-amino-thiazoline-4-carboxylic acid hydrolase [Synergistaceae bacterium]|jgi:hypothetical protein|nr:L-2-amino-thiazoline-4-carboxylic acid hydrolase [Synergistaceae bacterium]
MNDISRDEFYIEDHATLFALLAKNAIDGYSEGRSATTQAIASYGRERGMRAAARCMADGLPLSMENYILYGEWADPRNGSRAEIAALEPNYKTNVSVCGWCEAWKKHGLLEYGKIYCDNADLNLVRGFNPDLELGMGGILSRGDAVCEFDWLGCKIEDTNKFALRRSELTPQVTRDFLYHCGHLLSTFRRVVYLELGLVAGRKIISRAMRDYENIFGAEKTIALSLESEKNFLPL